MSGSIEVRNYDAVRAEIGSGRSHLLLGNGFSIGCDPIFRYESLYEVAVAAGLSAKAQAAFARLGTNNFEGVLHLLEDTHWLCGKYGIEHPNTNELIVDVAVVKNALVKAVSVSHLDHSGSVPEAKKQAARAFLEPYHNIFTTNYDLLIYWTILSGGPVSHGDGFRSDEDNPDGPYVVFTERLGKSKGLFYLHGALHIYMKGAQLRKHTWNRTSQRLTDQIRASLEAGEYPLIVAEGSPEKKLEQIERNGYLWYALDKLRRVEGPLVIHGHSLGPTDQHILDAISSAEKVKKVFVGIHGDPDSDANLKIRAAAAGLGMNAGKRRRRGAEVSFFDSATARVWG